MARIVASKVLWVGRATAFAFGLTVIVALFLALAARPAHAADFTVTKTADTGDGACDADCSLREAIVASNTAAGADTIGFNIAGSGPHTISLTSDLPTITGPVTIDGYTQGDSTTTTDDDAKENTLTEGTNAVLKIELDGTATTEASGLQVNSDGFAVKGLIINDFDEYGVILGDQRCLVDNSTIEGNFIGTNATGTAAGPGNVFGGVSVCGKNNVVGGTTPEARNVISGNSSIGIAVAGNSSEPQQNRIVGNLIGTNAAGTSAVPNDNGVAIGAVAGGNLVGGTTPASRNIISGNRGNGVSLLGDLFNISPGDTIQGNYIGTDVSGNAALPNEENGVYVEIANNNTTIGGSDADDGATDGSVGARNVISANKNHGIAINSRDNMVQGNLIGLKADGTGSLGNGNPTFRSGSGMLVNASNNTIGGTAAGAGNSIANNAFMGIQLFNTSSEGNRILSNSIFSNGRLGIDLVGGTNVVTTNDTGDTDNFVANRGQNFPVITSASVSGGNATLSGTLNSNQNSSFRLEFFANESCNANVSGFGNEPYGEGQTLIGSTQVNTGGDGNVSFGPLTFAVPAGQSVITATATNTSTNNTSEFSECRSPAANSAPTATNDLYATGMDQQLAVAAPGVLSNDTDPESNALTAIKVSDPTNGTLNGTFNSNGSFTYTPNAGFTGTDSFTYRANDGTSNSNVATVTINVQPSDTTPPTLDISNGVTPRNGQTRVSRTTNISATFSEPMSLISLRAAGVFTLKNTRNGSTVNPASITLSSDGTKVTFDPAPPRLARKTRYEVRIKGGPGGAADVAGNTLAADAVWTFTTRRR